MTGVKFNNKLFNFINIIDISKLKYRNLQNLNYYLMS
jgi:hypothetical protein